MTSTIAAIVAVATIIMSAVFYSLIASLIGQRKVRYGRRHHDAEGSDLNALNPKPQTLNPKP